MAVDWNRALERAAELKDKGYTDDQVSAVLDAEAEAADRAAQQYGHQSAQASRSGLQEARSSLNAESRPPGELPDEDPISRGFALADQSGHQRGSEQRMQTYVDGIFQAAQRGDPRVVHEGTIDDETRQRWHREAHQRQISNREQSQARHR